MVITRLSGGLGNQMFQYAAGRSLAHRHGVELKLDASLFEHYTLREYSLSRLNIQAKVATPEEIEKLIGWRLNIVGRAVRKGWRLVLHGVFGMPRPWYYERHFHFDQRVQRLSPPMYLSGYWASEKYFADISDAIREEFTVRNSLVGMNKEMGERIRDVSSVSMHVRRGDYVSNPRAVKVHGVCSMRYYQRAMEWIAQRVIEPHFFVFSDDPEWAKANLVSKHSMTIVAHNGPDTAYEDLRLMGQCEHNIIANSTFSWWGAWLNPNPKKIVCAPRPWFSTFGEAKWDTRDLLPASWIALSS